MKFVVGVLMAERKSLLRSIRENFFLKRHVPSDSTIKILKDLYPNVNWNRVDFYEGLPWFTSTIAPYVTAQALPNFYSLNRFRIYITKFDESRAQCLADIVHEGFHVMQAMRFLNGYGFGFFRGFMFYYIAVFLKHGYRQNAFEVPAYDQEFRFLDYCAKRGLHGIVPKVKDYDLTGISKESSLVFPKFEFRYRENFVLLLGSLLFCTVVSILKPIVDLLLVIFFPISRLKLARVSK